MLDENTTIMKKSVKSGSVSLPVPNILALSALKKLTSNENLDNTERLVITVWILENQNSERLYDLDNNPPTREELTKTAIKIDIENIGEYISCLEEIEHLLVEKNRGWIITVNTTELVSFLLRRYPALTLKDIMVELNIINIADIINADIILTERSREIFEFFNEQ
ncbi:MAG: hypothetical protein ACUVWP_07610 [bacterium]